MKKATRQQTKDHNTRLVFKTLYNAGELSRADIARATGLTRPTVSAIIGDLLDDGLVEETGLGPSIGGKPPTMLGVNERGRHLLCMDLSGNEFRGAIVNVQGEIQVRKTIAVQSARAEEALEHTIQLADSLVTEATAPLLGIGVATPGLVDPRRGIVQRAVNLGWTDLPLRDILQDRFDQPVYVANDSHLTALAEYTFGPETESHHLIAIRIGQGIGAGVVLNGQPFYGDAYGAGEIGHVVVRDEGDLCSCGNSGCLETTSSTRAMLQQANLFAEENPGSALAEQKPVTWDVFAGAVARGDEAAIEITRLAGRYLGVAVANLVGAYNIEQIVLAGRVTVLGDIFLDAVRAEMRRRVLPGMADATNVRFSTLGNDVVLLGASALLLHKELGIV